MIANIKNNYPQPNPEGRSVENFAVLSMLVPGKYSILGGAGGKINTCEHLDT
jgi:hypothetical protein